MGEVLQLLQHGRQTEWGWFSDKQAPLSGTGSVRTSKSTKPHIPQIQRSVRQEEKAGGNEIRFMTWGNCREWCEVEFRVSDCLTLPHGLRQASGPSRGREEILPPQA